MMNEIVDFLPQKSKPGRLPICTYGQRSLPYLIRLDKTLISLLVSIPQNGGALKSTAMAILS